MSGLLFSRQAVLVRWSELFFDVKWVGMTDSISEYSLLRLLLTEAYH